MSSIEGNKELYRRDLQLKMFKRVVAAHHNRTIRGRITSVLVQF